MSLKVTIQLCDVCYVGSEESREVCNYLYGIFDAKGYYYQFGQLENVLEGTIDFGNEAVTLVKGFLAEILEDDPYILDYQLVTI